MRDRPSIGFCIEFLLGCKYAGDFAVMLGNTKIKNAWKNFGALSVYNTIKFGWIFRVEWLLWFEGSAMDCLGILGRVL